MRNNIWLTFLIVSCLAGICGVRPAGAVVDTAGENKAVLEGNCVDLDRENVELLAEKARREQESVAKQVSLGDKIRQLNEANQLIESLRGQVSSLVRKNQESLRQNAVQQSVIRKAKELLDRQTEAFFQLYTSHQARLSTLRKMEPEVGVLRANNEKLAKLNAQLRVDAQGAIRKAQEIVAQKARSLIEVQSRAKRLGMTVKALEAKLIALQSGNERLKDLNTQLEAKGKQLFLKNNDIEYKFRGYDGLGKAADRLNREVVLLKKENIALKKKIAGSKNDINRERASLYREAGAAYAQTGLVDESIRAYLFSLDLDPSDPMSYYYLGLLKAKKWQDVEAVSYFKKYLALVPLAENREEVEKFMEILLGRSALAIK